ncbi:MAG: PilZ domain-containing protein [Mariprofundus sp.]
MIQNDDRRAFVRHPVDMPIQVFPQLSPVLSDVQMRDLGNGGIAFRTNVALDKGTVLTIVIPHVEPPFEETCMVCWSQPENDAFEIGVRFLDPEGLFKARLVEQVCHIEDYRRQERGHGRELTRDESAREWIGKYAADFNIG